MRFRSDRGPIAIVGCGFRMPGGARGDAFWDALIGGRSLVSSVAADRWAQEPYLHPRKSEPGSAYTFAAGSIGDVAGFDAAFFGISPREAEEMDPQQRVLLEMTWEAFENASIRPSSLCGSRCGVYVGLSSIDYAYQRADDLGSIDSTTMTGNAGSIAANRISYLFDLRGPSLVVDTACSSSLVALHQACQSLRHGESDAALACGISLHLHPYAFIGFSKASMLSRQGRCAVFDAAADGYVRSEGGAVLLLKPLAQAVADGNRILAVVAESGVNSDGHKQGLTVPSPDAQADLLREVYERAGIPPAALDYFEAHGTGTAVGDPIEARAIGAALGRHRSSERPLPVGSVKGHVGHLEAASGMAGLVKTLYVLRHRRVPANLHLMTPNPQIDFAGLNLAPVTEPLALESGRRIIVGVSAFGFGGTNAHAILTSYESAALAATRPSVRPPLLLSARSPAALRASAGQMAQVLSSRADLSEYDIAYSAFFGRDVHPLRLLVGGEDRSAVAGALERFAETGAAPGVVTGRFRADASGPAFVYCGNGSQWIGMGVQLLEEDATFRESVAEIDALLGAYTDRSIAAELRAPSADSRLGRTEVGQPALFAVQVGVTRMLARAGIRPAAVCGHSVGEVAAAWAAGALSLQAAVRVIHERSAHQAATRGHGGMTAVELAEDDVLALLHSLELQSEVALAAVNAPGSVTLAGESAALTRLEAILARRSVAFRRLALEHAFHSASMDRIRDGLTASLSDLAPQAASIPLYSTVTGVRIEGADLGPLYWWRNVREPVRFASAVRGLLEGGINTLVEIGPRPVLTAYMNEIGQAAGRAILALPSLTVSDAGAGRVRALGQQLEVSGALHDASRLFPAAGRLVDLPLYPWQRERHWRVSTPESLGTLQRVCSHPLLGYLLGEEPVQWENHLDTCKLPGLADHAVGGAAVFPAAGFVEMALAAGAARRPGMSLIIEDLEILSPLLLEHERSSTVRLRVDPDGSFTIVSRDRASRNGWRTHAVGRLVEESVLTAPQRPPPAHGAPQVTAARHYELARALGLEYGPAFQSVSAVWLDAGAALAQLTVPPGLIEHGALLHPASLDGAFQLLMDLVRHEFGGEEDREPDMPTFLPVRIERLELAAPGGRVTAARATLGTPRHRSRRALIADFALYDASGATIALARGVRFRAASVQRGAPPQLRCLTTRAVPMPRRAGGRACPAPPTEELARLIAVRLHRAERGVARSRYAHEVEPLLDVLCAAFAERALRALAGEAALDPAHLLTAGQVSAEAAPLLRSLAHMLAEDGVLEETAAGWRWAAPVAHFPEPHDIWLSLIGDYPEYGAATARVGSAGLRLAARLRAGAKPGEPDVAEGASWWLDGMTRDEAVALYSAIADVLAGLAATLRPHSRLRVLRIIGAAPREELARAFWPEVNRDRCDLVLAARTQQLLDEVRMRCPEAARTPGHVLDLDQPGLRAAEHLGGRFDMVILSEGLAGCAAPLVPLENIRRLLLEAGTLLLLEQHPSRSADLVFGLRPDWWTRVDPGGAGSRPVPRWRSPRAWSALLARAGFDGLQTVRDFAQAASGPYLMLMRAARAADEVPAHYPDVRTRGTWLLLHDDAGDSAELAAAVLAGLEQHNQHVVRVVTGVEYAADAACITLDPCSPTHWDRLLAQLQRGGTRPDGWVHLSGLDLGSGAMTSAKRAALQQTRAEALLAWLQASGRSAFRPACWVVAAQAGLGLLPAGARAALKRDSAELVDGARDAPLWGLTRVAQHEYPELPVRWVDLLTPTPFAASAAKLVQELLEPDAEDEVLLAADGRFVPRLDIGPDYTATADAAVSDSTPPRFHLDFRVPGPFRNLRWRREEPQAGGAPALAPGGIEIGVHAAGLNFRDVMYAMGLLPDEAVENGFCGPALGIEVAGVVLRVAAGVTGFAAGDEVMAIAPGAFATRVRTAAWAAVPKPAGWSFAAAATVPAVFFTAYYALVELARLREGERLLVHGAAGGVGIAAMQIARHIGAEVFATAGSPLKRDFARLSGADHVFDSRSLTFADEILAATGGEGVDVVLNSLAGEAMRRSVRLLRPFGRMLELGKRDFYENSRLGLRPFRNNIAYFGIDAEQLLAARPQTVQRCFAELRSLFASGVLRPLPHQSFCASDVEAAFRLMQPSRHIGKVVVTFPRDFAPVGPAPRAVPAPQLRADATYLVTGGLSGFGLRTAQWLAALGARHLALVGRRANGSPETAQALARLAAAGVTVHPLACDVADPAALQAMLAEVDAHMPPLRGVVHAAAVIEDALIRDLDREQLRRVLSPKSGGAWCLHEATRHRVLDFFVLYSSATTLFGNPGQGAYVAANMALEALTAERRALGLPATCVGFGPIGDAGYLARNETIRDALLGRIGGRALSAQTALDALGALLTADAPPVGLLELDWSVLGRFLPGAAAPKFSELARRDERDPGGAAQPQDLKRWLEELPAAELVAALTEVVRGEIAQILRTPPERLDAGVSLVEIGMDSLMAVELATSIEVRLGVQLSAMSLSDGPTIERIAARIARQLRPANDGGEAAPGNSGLIDQVRFVAAQHASTMSETEVREFSEEMRTSEPAAISAGGER